MPWLERMNPESPCRPDEAHHPHRMVSSDSDCDCWQDTDDGAPYSLLSCCVCGQDWPCDTKQAHVAERKGA